MACVSSTAPINISSKDYSDDCSLKCLFKYNYPRIPATTITNEGNYLSISYDKVTISYNNTPLLVQGIRLYTPSLHTYNGVHADAEIVISHMDMGISLLVCIPVVISSNKTDASKSLDYLINQAASKTPNAGEKSVVPTKNFTLNSFIPKKAPLYSYSATLPYAPCNGDHQYVVFMPENTPVFISSNTMATLKKIIVEHDSSIKPKIDYYYNKQGAIYANADSDDGDDDIYIDCQPTGADGEPINVPNSSKKQDTGINFDNPMVVVILGILGGILFIILFSIVVQFFRGRRGRSAAAAAGDDITTRLAALTDN